VTPKWMAPKRREEGLLVTQCASSVGSVFTGNTSCISICPRNITPVTFVNGRVFRFLFALTGNILVKFSSDILKRQLGLMRREYLGVVKG
jgi:hypothetical protein